MIVRSIKYIFLFLVILTSTLGEIKTESRIMPNPTGSSSIITIKPIKPALIFGEAWEVDDLGLIKIEGSGAYEIIYYVDDLLTWTGKVQLPYEFKTSFRGLREGNHIIRLELEDENENGPEKSFVINVSH